jgi:hypothetical protein
MKNIIEKINEGKNCCLYSEVQNEVGKGGEYHTYSIMDGQKKFKKGFIYINSDEDFFGIQALNNSKEYEEFVGVEEGLYSKLDDLKVGETTEIDHSTIIRIW